MMTNPERVEALHARMLARQRLRERRTNSALAAGCAGLTLCLMLLIFDGGTAHRGGTTGLYTGAAMLFTGAGAYVLTALLAFMAGVVLTVILRKQTEKGHHSMHCGQDGRSRAEAERRDKIQNIAELKKWGEEK